LQIASALVCINCKLGHAPDERHSQDGTALPEDRPRTPPTLRPKLALETVYRWRAALRSGKGITDDKKRLLIEATAGTAESILWADFQPPEDKAGR
jgi:hypothetical protein